MELQQVSRMGSMSGNCLTPEEYSNIEVGMMQRLLEENLSGKMFFWGKITGKDQDYVIAYNIDPFAEFPERKYYFTYGGKPGFERMPELKSEYIEKADAIREAFKGDPSFGYTEEDEPEPEEGEAPVEKFREIHRLHRVVMKIDHDCALVPRDAMAIDATKKVITNKFFEGLGYQSAGELRSYMHMRYPEQLQGIALLKKPGIIKSGDFLDCVDKDLPSGVWTVKYDRTNTQAHVSNLYWPGYSFYSIIKSSEYGGAYFGNGLPMYDIAFML